MRYNSDLDWIEALSGGGPRQGAAIADLRLRVFSIILAHLKKAHVAKGIMSAVDATHLAEDCTQEAIINIQNQINNFRGESKFTTWIYVIAIRTVLAEVRRRQWREKALEEAQIGNNLPIWPIQELGPEQTFEQKEAWKLLSHIINNSLTPLQKRALIAHAFQDMPLDEVAEWMGSTRNSLYKLIHDARKRIKRALREEGLTHKDIIAIFDDKSETIHLKSQSKKLSDQRIL